MLSLNLPRLSSRIHEQNECPSTQEPSAVPHLPPASRRGLLHLPQLLTSHLGSRSRERIGPSDAASEISGLQPAVREALPTESLLRALLRGEVGVRHSLPQ